MINGFSMFKLEIILIFFKTELPKIFQDSTIISLSKYFKRVFWDIKHDFCKGFSSNIYNLKTFHLSQSVKTNSKSHHYTTFRIVVTWNSISHCSKSTKNNSYSNRQKLGFPLKRRPRQSPVKINLNSVCLP